MPTDPPVLTVPDVAAWRGWLAEHVDDQRGVWLVLAKKGTTEPTSLVYADALEEALCQGWIDGQVQSVDAGTYRQRFTPRRARSLWSRRNVGLVERLTLEGRMQPAGLAEVERARKDGRWEAAYAGSATIEVPDDLTAALAAHPDARARFDTLSRQSRYTILFGVTTARRPATRARRIEQAVAMLADGRPTPSQSTVAPDAEG
ncbi:YdeI/OmpD-associated family protein [Cellulomonas aerilata]|uniref:YdeI/OmpD-associated family protein n=1 Tax=Cellulomonas aerilata TaxID=515326 RepID=UPI0011BDC02C|nr:YdeI/OmpD-associated family protein [Cellulomonas aerilata]